MALMALYSLKNSTELAQPNAEKHIPELIMIWYGVLRQLSETDYHFKSTLAHLWCSRFNITRPSHSSRPLSPLKPPPPLQQLPQRAPRLPVSARRLSAGGQETGSRVLHQLHPRQLVDIHDQVHQGQMVTRSEARGGL